MARFLKDKSASLKSAPGAPVFIGEQKMEQITMHLIEYSSENLEERKPTTVTELVPSLQNEDVSWININGLHDTDLIREIGDTFHIHPLVIEDILYTGQRPKMEEYDEYLFFVLKMMHINEKKSVVNEQISIILGKNFILTFQERPGDVFDPIRKRIREHKGRVRECGNDYLAYALIDTIVDNYLIIIEDMGGKIEDIEDEIFGNFDKSILSEINNFKHEMNYLRKTIRPVRDSIQKMTTLDTELFDRTNMPYFNDLLDLSTQARDIVDTYRDMLNDHLDIYNSEVNNKLNDIMKILTIFSAIFIPLTFIAGIYGTNFEYLPELKYRYSYFIFWGVLVLVATGMLGLFKKKKWI